MQSASVVIIGAGIGGLAAAVALQRAGVEVQVYEQAESLRELGAGLTLWTNAVKALDKIGLADMLIHIGYSDGGGLIRRADGTVLQSTSQADLKQRYGASNYAVHRIELLRELAEAAGSCVQYNKSFSHYTQNAHRITAHFHDGTSVTADALIGADGIRSTVRQQSLPNSQPRYAGYTAWRAVVEFDHAITQHQWGESWGRASRFGLVPLKHNRIYWFATDTAPAGTHIPAGERLDFLLERFKTWHTPIADIIAATPEQAILQHDIYYIDPLPTWVNGHAVLLGDAAHAMTPDMGQGACQAIEDAIVLAKQISRHETIDGALWVYDDERRRHANHVMRQSRRIGRIAQSGNALLAPLRDTVMRLLPTGMSLRALDTIIGHEV